MRRRLQKSCFFNAIRYSNIIISLKSNPREYTNRNVIRLNYFYNILSTLRHIENDEAFATIYAALSEKNKGILYKQLKQIYESSIEKKAEKSQYSPDESFEELNAYSFLEKVVNNPKIKTESINTILQSISEELKSSMIDQSYGLLERLNMLRELFGLNDTELEVIQFSFMSQHDSEFDDGLSGLISKFSRSNPDYKYILSIATGVKITKITQSLSSESNIFRYRMLDSDNDVSPELAAYLDGTSTKPLDERYYSKLESDTLPTEWFDKQDEIKYISGLLKNTDKSIKILFYGKPGTGKTELAKSIAKECDMPVYEIKQKAYDMQVSGGHNSRNFSKSNDEYFRKRALQVADKTIKSETGVLLIDEADGLLNTRDLFGFANDDKSEINDILDKSKTKQIWIINHHSNIDDSTKRRFNYCLEFSDPGFKQRKSIWQNIVSKNKLSDSISVEDIDILAEKYMVSAGIIDKSIENLKVFMKANRHKKIDLMAILEESIKSHVKLIHGNDFDKIENRKPNSENYGLDGLNIKTDINRMLKTMERFNTDLDNKDRKVKNMNILMWGPPGTGKTELAKYIARTLNRKLIIKSASDILNPYVGVSEKIIKSAFKEAEEQKAILFMDEIDGLLSSREGAQRSWEVTQVNELLVNMENFSGIFIAATNFMKNVDQAAVRRYNLKVEFDYLEPEGSVVFFNRFFESLVKEPLTADQVLRLKKLKSLTPGDFKVVSQKNVYNTADDITPDEIISQLEEELSAKSVHIKKQVGFV